MKKKYKWTTKHKKKHAAGLKKMWRRRGPQTIQDYIKSKTIRIGKCLIWKTARPGTYGCFEFKFKSGSPSRCIYEALVSPPGNLCVLHSCDNPRCVNIKHLRLGTRKDNRADFMKRHPRAKQITKTLTRNGRKAVQKFWRTLTPEERKKFIKRRAKIQQEKYPKGHGQKERVAGCRKFWKNLKGKRRKEYMKRRSATRMENKI